MDSFRSLPPPGFGTAPFRPLAMAASPPRLWAPPARCRGRRRASLLRWGWYWLNVQMHASVFLCGVPFARLRDWAQQRRARKGGRRSDDDGGGAAAAERSPIDPDSAGADRSARRREKASQPPRQTQSGRTLRRPPEFDEAPTARAAVGGPPPMHCRNGHALRSDSAAHDEMACDECGNGFLLGEAILSCRLCDYDRCSPRCWQWH